LYLNLFESKGNYWTTLNSAKFHKQGNFTQMENFDGRWKTVIPIHQQ